MSQVGKDRTRPTARLAGGDLSPEGAVAGRGAETVKSFKSEAEAHLALGKLATVGIQATVNRFSRYRSMAGGGYQLKVRPDQLDRARAVLDEIGSEIDMDEYVDADDKSYTRCAKCRSVNLDRAPLPSRDLLLAIVLLGIPLLFIKRDYTCRKCHHSWRE